MSNNSSMAMNGLLGSGASDAAAASSSYAMMEKQQQQHQPSRHVISANSSVVSAASSSTKSSSLTNNNNKFLLSRNSSGSDGSEEKKEDGHAINNSSKATSSQPTSSTDPSSMLGVGAPPHPVAEFLFQLTKMLTDNNGSYIEWKNASIFVHDPPGLEKDILPKYFRHSNYSSFQRQMNYFGFRKIAGKGKMAPCSYVNENAKEDISSLLFIRRKKTGVSSAAAKLMAQQNRINRCASASMGVGAVPQGMGGMQGMAGMMGMAGGMQGMATGAMGAAAMNNFSMMGGMPGMGAGGTATGNMMASAAATPASNPTQGSALLNNQQAVLAQLQQAHASALSTACPAPAAQNKLGAMSMSNPVTSGLLTNDQGNIYNMTSTSNADAAKQAQALLMQQGLVGGSNFPQAAASGMSSLTGSAGGSSDNLVRLDSAANLRALINQQISMFTPGQTAGDVFTSSAMSGLGGSYGAAAASMGQPSGLSQGQVGASTQQVAGAPASQGLSWEWNEMLQRTAGMQQGAGGATGATGLGAYDGSLESSTLRQLEQQLLQQQGGAAAAGAAQGPGAAAASMGMGQSFGLNGFGYQ